MDDIICEEAVVIVPYDPRWPARFEAERAKLAKALGGLQLGIDHVGSTAVPGLAAKPIIDIIILVDRLRPAIEYAPRLGPLGYIHYPLHDDPSQRLFFDDGRPRTRHLSIIEQDAILHRRYLVFRDYLRSHPEPAREYERLKKNLAERCRNDRPAYTEGKTAFIRAIEARCL